MTQNLPIRIEQKILSLLFLLSQQAGDKYGVPLEKSKVIAALQMPESLANSALQTLLVQKYVRYPSDWPNFIYLTSTGYALFLDLQKMQAAEDLRSLDECLGFIPARAYRDSLVTGVRPLSVGPAYRMEDSDLLSQRRIRCTLAYRKGIKWETLSILDAQQPLLMQLRLFKTAYLCQKGEVCYHIEEVCTDAEGYFVFVLRELKTVTTVEFSFALS